MAVGIVARLLALAGLLVVFVTLGASAPASSAGAPMPEDVTFKGELGEATTGDPNVPITAGGGTITVTLTPDLSGVLRARIDGFEWSVYPDDRVVTESGGMYYDPPVPVVNGAFELTVTFSLSGVHTGMTVEGAIASPSELTGTAMYGTSVGFPSIDVPWSAAGPIDTPPGPGDEVLEAQLQGTTGTLLVALNENDDLTAFAVQDISFAPCLAEPVSFRAFSEEPVSRGQSAGALLLSPVGLSPFSFWNIERVNGVLSGELSLVPIYFGDCEISFHWTAGVPYTPTAPPPTTVAPTSTPTSASGATAAATPQATSTVLASQLPSAGAPTSGASTALPLALTIAGALLLGGGLALRARRT